MASLLAVFQSPNPGSSSHSHHGSAVCLLRRVVAAALVGEDPRPARSRQAWDPDVVPLQSLGLMDRHDTTTASLSAGVGFGQVLLALLERWR